MESKSPKDRAAELKQRQDNSQNWMKSSFYPEWEAAYKAYKCIVDQPKKEEGAEDDPDRLAVGMPDTWSLVRRQVARVTAQPPNLKVTTEDQALADRISRKLMRDWDLGGTQRQQKKHVMQASIFGWSVRGWFWDRKLVRRTKRVDPFNEDPQAQAVIAKYYAEQLGQLQPGQPIDPVLLGQLVADYGRGGLLPVKYDYVAYEGPRAETLFVGDVFPMPNYQGMQSSKWFMVRRRRSKTWLESLGELYPDLKEGIQKLFDRFPKGTPEGSSSDGGDVQQLRHSMLAILGRSDSNTWTGSDETTGVEAEYTVVECHEPGVEPKLLYLAEGSIYLGEIDYPYELEGRIAFTDLVLIDDLVSGIGDSHARIIRGLQRLHERQVNARMNLVYNILRPLVWTANRELYENPELVKRGDGFRMVSTFGPNDMGILGEQAALAAAASGLNNDGDIVRLIQQATGETNMSMSANVDPQQGRTATGARLIAYNSDILTRDANDAFNESCLIEDARTMYLLNRSEMPESVGFDAAKYIRTYDPRQPIPDKDYITVTPHDFQHDDVDVIVESGSTIADDDEAKVTKAQTLFQAAMGAPTLFNAETARDEFLIAMGKGKELQKWVPPPPPPQSGPHPEPPRISIAMKFELLPQEVQMYVLQQSGLMPPQPAGPPPGPAGPPPDAAAPPPPRAGTPPNLPVAPPDNGLPMGGAEAAAMGKLPPQTT